MMNENPGSFRVPEKIYFKKGCLPVALEELKYVYHNQKVLVVTDPDLQKQGKLKLITDKFNELGITYAIHDVNTGMTNAVRIFEPDCILAFGEEVLMSLVSNLFNLFIADKKIYLITVPCFAGMYSQVQPISSDMVIIDTDLMDNAPDMIRRFIRGALYQAINACDSPYATDYSDSMAIQAIHLIFAYLPEVLENPNHAYAMEKLASAGTMAGIAHFNAHARTSFDKSENHARCAELLGMDLETFTRKLEEIAKLY
ncbi:MAG: iron-containing alcohol dehydrogenase [Oscillospiraceae bacterium]|nr:iron-containing alcohol dehydrogenase [Oscillospiraceae bacterium]